MLLQIRRHAASHYSQTNESNFHFGFFHQAGTNSGSFSFFLSFDLCDFHNRETESGRIHVSFHCFALRAPTMAQITNFRSRSQPETPTLLRQSLEMRRGERAYPYTAFGSS